eukprot:6191647-Amphidinium_carterae.1
MAKNASKLSGRVSRYAKERLLLVPCASIDLQGCHLVPVGKGDTWKEPLSDTYGKSEKWWLDMRDTIGVGLPEQLHKSFDRNIGSQDAHIAFLSALKHMQPADVCPKTLLVLTSGFVGDAGLQACFQGEVVKITQKTTGWEVDFAKTI